MSYSDEISAAVGMIGLLIVLGCIVLALISWFGR